MTDEAQRHRAVVDLLRDVGGREVEGAPRQHSEQTAACLPLLDLDNALDAGLSDAQRAHVPGCAFCQKLIAMRWRLECPGIPLLLLHLGSSPPFSIAVAEHIELDACRRCQRVTSSRLLRTLAGRLSAGREHELVLGRVAADYAPLPAVVGAFAAPPRIASSQTDATGAEREDPERSWPFRLRVIAPGGMSATLRQTDRDALLVQVQSTDPNDAGRTVDIEVAGESESLEASVVLRKRGRRFEGRHTFGRLADLRPFLGPACALVVVAGDVPDTPAGP